MAEFLEASKVGVEIIKARKEEEKTNSKVQLGSDSDVQQSSAKLSSETPPHSPSNTNQNQRSLPLDERRVRKNELSLKRNARNY
jgi:hypothetical protein